ncbi:MAG: hypothetical protein L6R36_009473, partial [Xanthoria steineri]
PTETLSYGTEQKQGHFEPTTSSDRGIDVSENYTASWAGGNEIDPAVDSAVGRWDDEHHATTSAVADCSDDEDNDPDTETDCWDTDDDEDTEITDGTEYLDDPEESGWWCPDEAADRGIAVGGWEDA